MQVRLPMPEETPGEPQAPPRGEARNLAGKLSSFAKGVAAQGKRVLVRLRPSKDYVVHHGTVLPPRALRFNHSEQQDDRYYVTSADTEADRVVTTLGYTPDQLIVDVGCGQGRLAIGLTRRHPAARYLGLDVSQRSIAWCRAHIEWRYPSYQFHHVDLVNARYNPGGQPLSPHFRLPVGDGAADIVYMWGLVTNMEPEHLPIYAAETSRMLRPGGKAFVTANVEDDVPRVSINPANYTAYACSGPLHVVRYEKHYFLDVFERAGLKMIGYSHESVGNHQSEIYFAKPGA